jgi:methylation protein EvaC
MSSQCHNCKSETELVIDFGVMPISNRYKLGKEDEEFTFNLSVGFCDDCKLAQLSNTVPPEEMFNENYAFYSSTSKVMAEHFKNQAGLIFELCKAVEDPFVVELGSNDGIMLQHISKRGVRHLGVEPSQNVAEMSRGKGVNAISEFFCSELVTKIIDDYGKADVICGSNVVCHIQDINSVFEGVSNLLTEDGVFFFEDPYLFDIVNKTSFDQIYDEHLFYFSCLSVQAIANKFDLELVDVELLPVHGGEARYFIKRKGNNIVSDKVHSQVKKEISIGLNKIEGFKNFSDNIIRVSEDLFKTVNQLKQEGHKIVGYGATSKSSTLLNFAGLNSSHIDYIVDNTPSKIGKFTPQTNIPIISYENLADHDTEYALLLAWNHAEEIMSKEVEYKKQGGKFITFFPSVEIK